MRPWITEPYRRVPGELFSAVGHGEIDADKRPGRLKPGHEELFSRRVVEFYPGEWREVRAPAGPQRARGVGAVPWRGGRGGGAPGRGGRAAGGGGGGPPPGAGRGALPGRCRRQAGALARPRLP